MILRHVFEPTDNRRLAHLSGAFDAHLRAIEAALGVRIGRRGAAFRVEGGAAEAARALALLQRLYRSAARSIPDETLQLALVEAQAPPPADAAPGLPSAPSVVPALPAPKRSQRAGAAARPAAPAREAAPAAAAPLPGAGPAAPLPGAEAIQLHTRRSDLRGRTPAQLQYLRNILGHDISFGIGPAGTGKTFLAVACAVDALERGTVQRIVLTRPAVEAGERLGFLPGDLTQKVNPYLRPLYDALYDLMGAERVAAALEKGVLEIAPLAFMRGRTLNHAFVILDEAQNTTPEQMKMFLTRIGFGARAVITGDTSQVDLPRGAASGLVEAAAVLAGVRGIAFTQFSAADVVRHPLVARIVEAYAAASPDTGASA